MICGSYVLTDSMSNAFGAIYTQIYKNTDAVITGKSAISSSDATAPPFPRRCCPRSRCPASRRRSAASASSAHLIGKNGKAISHGGAPQHRLQRRPEHAELSSITFASGTWPGPNEVVIDKRTAGNEHWKVGDTIGVQAEGPAQKMRLAGIFLFGGSTNIGGATLAGFELGTAQRIFDKVGKLDQIRVQAKPGVSPQELVDQIEPVLTRSTSRSGRARARRRRRPTTRTPTSASSRTSCSPSAGSRSSSAPS